MGKDNYIITISRGYGSGGKHVAQKLSQKLNIPLLDRELLKMASVASGINEEMFDLADEKVRKKLFFSYSGKLYEGGLLPPEDSKFTSDQNLFNYQAEVMRTMSNDKSFIVLGRAGFYVLRNIYNVFSFNIQAPFEDCVESVMEREGLSMKEAVKKVRSVNKYRDEYVKTYTGLEWWDSTYMDFVLNSSRIGRDACVDFIIHYIEEKLGRSLV